MNEQRAKIAKAIAIKAGEMAMGFFRRREDLKIDAKGHQDFVSEADRQVETLIRERLARALPDDAIVGEEHAPTPGNSGFTWVIDPIDGTTNFLNGIPLWCVAIAVVADGQTQIGVIHDPNHNETFSAIRGQGVWMNDKPLSLGPREISSGTVCVGSSRRSPPADVAKFVQLITESGGVFARTGSGALGLAYVAANRYIGYSESYMNAWDCLAGQLMIAEAGGVIEDQNADEFIANGKRVIAAAPGVFEDLIEINKLAFGE